MNVSTPNINLFDLTPEQLKRAASIKDRIDGLNKQLRGIHIASFANEKSEHERYCEKEDCGYSKSEVGKDSRFETGDGFCQSRGQEEENESNGEGAIVGQIKGVLGEEKKPIRARALNYANTDRRRTNAVVGPNDL